MKPYISSFFTFLRSKVKEFDYFKNIGSEKRGELRKYADPMLVTNHANSIFLLGNFQVFNKSGTDITLKFGRTLKELFVLILLYSIHHEQGIGANQLQEALWGNKDDRSARNNRNVNINKLRSLLKEAGLPGIVYTNGFFRFENINFFCDYRNVFNWINRSPETAYDDKTSAILNALDRGTLLPELHTKWVEEFKTAFTSNVIEYLLNIVYTKRINEDQMALRVAEKIFQFDALNENALNIKCNVLQRTGKGSLAKLCYENFSIEYQRLYRQKYKTAFQKIITDGMENNEVMNNG